MQAESVLDQDGTPVGEFRYQSNVANKALELIGRAIGVFVDHKKVSDRLTDDELERAFAREARQLGLSRERTATEQVPAKSASEPKSPTRH
jgi:hypothetical protein